MTTRPHPNTCTPRGEGRGGSTRQRHDGGEGNDDDGGEGNDGDGDEGDHRVMTRLVEHLGGGCGSPWGHKGFRDLPGICTEEQVRLCGLMDDKGNFKTAAPLISYIDTDT